MLNLVEVLAMQELGCKVQGFNFQDGFWNWALGSYIYEGSL